MSIPTVPGQLELINAIVHLSKVIEAGSIIQSEGNRNIQRYGMYSGAGMQAQLIQQMGDFMRNMRISNQTAGTMQDVSRAGQNLKNAMEPAQIMMINTFNKISSMMTNFTAGVVESLWGHLPKSFKDKWGSLIKPEGPTEMYINPMAPELLAAAGYGDMANALHMRMANQLRPRRTGAQNTGKRVTDIVFDYVSNFLNDPIGAIIGGGAAGARGAAGAVDAVLPKPPGAFDADVRRGNVLHSVGLGWPDIDMNRMRRATNASAVGFGHEAAVIGDAMQRHHILGRIVGGVANAADMAKAHQVALNVAKHDEWRMANLPTKRIASRVEAARHNRELRQKAFEDRKALRAARAPGFDDRLNAALMVAAAERKRDPNYKTSAQALAKSREDEAKLKQAQKDRRLTIVNDVLKAQERRREIERKNRLIEGYRYSKGVIVNQQRHEKARAAEAKRRGEVPEEPSKSMQRQIDIYNDRIKDLQDEIRKMRDEMVKQNRAQAANGLVVHTASDASWAMKPKDVVMLKHHGMPLGLATRD